jgi:hypothetical protein
VLAPVLSDCSSDDYGATCRRRGCSGSLSCSRSSSRVLNPFQMTVFLLLPAATLSLFPRTIYSVTLFTSSWEAALIDCCRVFLRCLVQCLRFLRSREPSSRTRSPGYRTGTSRTRTPANGSACGARRSTAAWLLCKDLPTTPMSHLIVPLVLAVLAGSGPCCVWVCVL